MENTDQNVRILDMASNIQAELLANRILPNSVAFERRTNTFTLSNVPPALLKDHKTSVWAKLVVEKGTLTFTEIANSEHDQELSRTLNEEDTQVISPEVLHFVTLEPEVSFHIEFYK